MSSLNMPRACAPFRGRNVQTVVLFVYSAVVTFALIFVVCRNLKPATEEIPVVSEMTLEESIAEEDAIAAALGDGTGGEGNVPEIYESERTTAAEELPEGEIELEAAESEPVTVNETIEVAKGDNFIGILQKAGMEYNDALDVCGSLKTAGFDVRALRAGQKLMFVKSVDQPSGEVLSVEKISFEPETALKYVVTRNEDEKYTAEQERLALKEESIAAEGVINTSLAAAMHNAGVPQSVIGSFTNIFSYTVDFRSEIRAGNGFKVLYERKTASDGKVVKNGDILYAELDLGREKIKLYRYKDQNGGVDYYNAEGLVLKRTLDRKPLAFRQARISSRFGWRRHPILKDRRLHSGVDYAAPKGTKIYASGDGVIRKAQYSGGYGNMVIIRHNSEYSTGYGHMNGFAKGIRPGVRVKQGQVIGYVGSTGRSTGPHLHFEVIKNGKKVDPLKVKAATGTNLAGKELARFKVEVGKITAQLQKGGSVDYAEAQGGKAGS